MLAPPSPLSPVSAISLRCAHLSVSDDIDEGSFRIDEHESCGRNLLRSFLGCNVVDDTNDEATSCYNKENVPNQLNSFAAASGDAMQDDCGTDRAKRRTKRKASYKKGLPMLSMSASAVPIQPRKQLFDNPQGILFLGCRDKECALTILCSRV